MLVNLSHKDGNILADRVWENFHLWWGQVDTMSIKNTYQTYEPK